MNYPSIGVDYIGKQLDSFERWEKQGVLKKKLKIIKDLSSKNVPQQKIAGELGISLKTLQKLKNRHPDFAIAFKKGKSEMKDNLISTIYKKAMGFEHEEVQTLVEKVGGRNKQKIVKNKKYYPPDLNSAKYLLIIKFGRDYNEKKDEIDIMEKRVKDKEEEWTNEII